MDDASQRLYATAFFDDQDAGSGPVHSSPNLGPMSAAIHNINARHLHDISNTAPDDRQFLRSWRRQIQECLSQQNSRMIRFLLSDVSGAVAESDVHRRATEVLTKYSRPTWNFGASTRELTLPTATDTAVEDITRDLGMSPLALRDVQKRAIRMYVSAASGVCAAEGRLEEKLKRLETVVGRVNDLMFLEPTGALEELAGPTAAYLDSVLGKISIEADYKEMMEAYKRFTVLKSIVSLSQFQKPAAPTCTICMTKELAQVVIPCGHTYCDECCRSQVTACYICRVQIRDKVRLYFS
jgi:hypothetical protein